MTRNRKYIFDDDSQSNNSTIAPITPIDNSFYDIKFKDDEYEQI